MYTDTNVAARHQPPGQDTQYKCIAPNYLKEIYDDSGSSLDYMKEQCCSQLKGVYTKKQIEKMSDFGIDLWKGLIWIDHEKLQHQYSITCIGEKYRLLQVIPGRKEITDEMTDRIKRMINTHSFYSVEDIQEMNKRLGIDIWTNAEWQTFKEKKLLKNGDGRDVVFYVSEV